MNLERVNTQLMNILFHVHCAVCTNHTFACTLQILRYLSNWRDFSNRRPSNWKRFLSVQRLMPLASRTLKVPWWLNSPHPNLSTAADAAPFSSPPVPAQCSPRTQGTGSCLFGACPYLKAEVSSKDAVVKWFDKDCFFCRKVQSLYGAGLVQ